MSPVSRGRKRKKSKGQTAKERGGQRGLFEVASPRPAPCDCPVCRGDGFDSEQLVDGLLGDAGALVAVEDPLEAEIAGAALLSVVALAAGQTGLGGELLEQVLLHGFIPGCQARASTEAMATLLALGSIAPNPVGAAASEAAAGLARAGIVGPRWAGELGTPVTTGACWRLGDPAGMGSVLGVSFARAGRTHAMLVFVDELECGAATDVALLDTEDLDETLASLRSPDRDQIGIGDHVGELVEETLDVAEWRWQTEVALDAREAHDREDLDEFDLDEFDLDLDEFDPEEFDLEEDEEGVDDELPSYPALALLLRARLAALPVSSKPKPPHGGHDEGLTVDITSLTETLGQLLPGSAGSGRAPSSPPGSGRVAKLPAKRARKDRPAPICQIKVAVRGAHPPIWRRLQLPADISLAGLHEVIQVAFDWEDDHMHVFRTPYGEFGAGADVGHRAEAAVTLEQVAPAEGDKIGYTYDFGDDWSLEVVVEKLAEADPAGSYPCCTGGRRAAPPEDCGGIAAYSHFVAALADPDHPGHDDALEWVGYTNLHPEFDPAHFNADAVTEALTRLR